MINKVTHKGLALAVLATAQFMVVLDATIVNVALPAIQKSLGFTTDSQLQWVVTAYALVFGGFLLLGGRLADLFGRRKLFLAGTALFATASVLGGISQTPEQLVLFRALQGLGGALLSPAALSLVLTIFKEGHERNKALSIWGMVAAGGGAIGMVLGGLLTQYIDWRWTFFINAPIALLVLYSALKYVPASPPRGKTRVDILGALTITGSLMSLVYALAMAPDKGWGSASTLGMFGLAAVLLVTFIMNELKVRAPLVRLGIFKRRNVTGGTLIMTLMSAGMFGMFFYLSIYLQHIVGYTPTVTGVANLPFTLTIIVIAGALSKHITRVPQKAMLVIAPLIMSAGLLYFSRIPVHSNYFTDILPGTLLMASGMAFTFVIGTRLTTSGVSHEESGLVSGLLNTGQQIGGAIGLAVLSVVSTAVTKNEMAAAHGNPAAMPNALVAGFHRGFLVAAAFAIGASLVAAVVLQNRKLSQQDLKDEIEDEAESMAAIPGV